jgi:hypothetical protein
LADHAAVAVDFRVAVAADAVEAVVDVKRDEIVNR